MTKKRSSEIFADENRTFFREGISKRILKCFENREKSETEGKCIMVSEGMDAPAGECLTRCTWCVWSMIFKDNNFMRTLLCCRLLNKMKGMKPTRELYLRRRSQAGDIGNALRDQPQRRTTLPNQKHHVTICFS